MYNFIYIDIGHFTTVTILIEQTINDLCYLCEHKNIHSLIEVTHIQLLTLYLSIGLFIKCILTI